MVPVKTAPPPKKKKKKKQRASLKHAKPTCTRTSTFFTLASLQELLATRDHGLSACEESCTSSEAWVRKGIAWRWFAFLGDGSPLKENKEEEDVGLPFKPQKQTPPKEKMWVSSWFTFKATRKSGSFVGAVPFLGLVERGIEGSNLEGSDSDFETTWKLKRGPIKRRFRSYKSRLFGFHVKLQECRALI